ncbi:hypothetical protein [Enterococcus sp. AZ102]|uniref:hypothetical protein n=1 Tax=unclassified Enterococcus TaxID=2608891 RepID=UPI003F2640A1
MKKKIDDIFGYISFWKQILIWLSSILISSKILDIFIQPDIFFNKILKIIISIVMGALIIYLYYLYLSNKDKRK